MSHQSSDPIEQVIAYLAPYIAPIVRRINVDEFTTLDFIEAMQMDEPTRLAYEEALRRWPERDERLAKMVVHGQVVPVLLRETGLVEWAGYAHGLDDPYAVPAWWRKTAEAESVQ